MIYNLENDFLLVKINSFGAEISNIIDKRDGYEYIWQGDSNYWGKRAPILFPIVGNLNNKRYKFEGKEYVMNQHGFAKEMEFTKIEHSESKLTLSLTYNDDTTIQYPFEFELIVSYILSATTLITEYNVKNTSKKDMWFSIGGHPGFCCSVNPEGKKAGKLLFPIKETVNYIENKSGYLTGLKKPFMIDENVIDVGTIDFNGKTKVYILEGLQSEHLIFEEIDKEKRVCISFRGFPYLGIWSSSNLAPFVCIEPLYGITSTCDVECDLRDKKGIMKLDAGKCFSCSFEITCEF